MSPPHQRRQSLLRRSSHRARRWLRRRSTRRRRWRSARRPRPPHRFRWVVRDAVAAAEDLRTVTDHHAVPDRDPATAAAHEHRAVPDRHFVTERDLPEIVYPHTTPDLDPLSDTCSACTHHRALDRHAGGILRQRGNERFRDQIEERPDGARPFGFVRALHHCGFRISPCPVGRTSRGTERFRAKSSNAILCAACFRQP